MGRRLLTVTHFFPAHGGGVELVAGHLVEFFASQGIAVEWFSSDTDPPPRPAPNQVAVAVPALNIVERVTQLPYPLWLPTAWPSLWRAIGRAEIIHIHELLYCGSLLAVMMARLRRRPVVITQHTGFIGLQGRCAAWLYAMLVKLLGRVVFRVATHAIFISANVRRFFNLENDPRAHLIYNGIDTELFTVAANQQQARIRAKLGLSPDQQVVLFVGRFIRKKGLPILQALAPRFPQVLWLLVGSGPEDPVQWGCSNVRVVGRLPPAHLADYYRAADLLLLPSSSEGFPLVVQEALACGLGVLSTEEVANACPPAQDMIRTQPTPRGDDGVTGWEQALCEILADGVYLEAREARGRRARDLWSWNRCASQYLPLFDELF